MRVLSIDGGGIRGIVPATVLAALEQRTARPVYELFDLIGGTSTGGILGLALTAPGPDGGPRWNATAIIDLYREEGPHIFERTLERRITSIEGLIDERYPSDNLREVLGRYLGGATFGEALAPIFVTSYDLVARKPRFFKSWRQEDAGVPMAIAAEATSAAPTYFEPVVVDGAPLIDGGVFAGNPAMCAYAEAVRLRPEDDDILVLSLGTGSQTSPIRFEQAKDWGVLEWARPIIDAVFDGSSDAVDYQLDQILGDHHFRLQAMLTDADDHLDDVSAENLRALTETGRRLVADSAAQLDVLAAKLVA